MTPLERLFNKVKTNPSCFLSFIRRSNGVQRYLVIVGLAVLALARPAAAADLKYNSFSSDITVKTDASITVKETIEVEFLTDKHGIYRNIPYSYKTESGGTATIPISQVRVTQDGKTVDAAQTRSGSELEIKIGDANKTITGKHTYVISYEAQAAANFFTDHDELYWNITGADWDQPLTNVRAKVTLPSADIGGVQLACYTGTYGSKESECQKEFSRGTASFIAQDFLTVVVGWPKGLVTKPGNYDQLRTPVNYGTQISQGLKGVLLGVNLGLLVLAGWLIYWFWAKRGRDPESKGTIIAQYDPPPELTPGEMGVIMDEAADQRDIIATMVDLAVRGHLTITEIETKKMFGQKKDYQLDRLTPDKDQPLRKYEQDLLDGLFADGSQVKLSDLKGTFAGDIAKIKSDLYKQVASAGYFVENPQSVKIKVVVLGAVMIGVGLLLAMFGILAVSIAGLAVICFAAAFPKRTPAGVEAKWHAEGFKLFLETAEKYRLKWQEKENIFETYLPYAMAFGVAEKWTKVFANLKQTPPSWYHGSSMSTFNTMVLWSALNDFSTVATQTFISPAASGGSGFGGGGFSGGGGGGGGGGGW